jgi:hypothetical protein
VNDDLTVFTTFMLQSIEKDARGMETLVECLRINPNDESLWTLLVSLTDVIKTNALRGLISAQNANLIKNGRLS